MLRATLLTAFIVALVAGFGCSQYRTTGGDAQASAAKLQNQAETTVERFKTEDPSLATFFENSYGYAVFPEVAKGAAGIGAAHGEGVVYERGAMVGTTTLTQGTIGAQLGGQTYSEIIFFEDDATLERFKQGDVEFSAQASAVAAAEGASANADYDAGVAVFTLNHSGLMFEASIGGQKFTFTPN